MLESGSVDKCDASIYISEAARICHRGLPTKRRLSDESCDFPEDDLEAVSVSSAGCRNGIRCAAIVYDERVCRFISSSAARPASP